MTEDLTVIIPVDLRYRHSDVITKAVFFAKYAERYCVKVIFGVSAHKSQLRRLILNEMASFENVSVVFSEVYTKNVNTSLLRNVAFNHCRTEYIALFDVDIFPDFELVLKYLCLLKQRIKPFYILPCLYLTQSASNSLIKGLFDVELLKEKYFSFSRKEFLHLACPSSLTLMNAGDYSKLNGFDINFEGHGYEDFDFLIRLSELHQLLESTQDLLIDKTFRSPLFSVGFRKHLGKLCFDSLVNKDFAFHLFHFKDNSSDYYKTRESNKCIFMSKHIRFLNNNPKEEYLLIHFIEYCKRNDLDLSDYSILFENKPGHVDRYDTFRRRMKFLFSE
ncbi:galactosyltransferase-related protein [Phytobacter ursingii]|uniref:galactosyltransferase-related protein n=1 Tax=Phytobacter ursingii TaxID=1972431 RepID=UPI000CD02328|nr:capsular biosynthesis protein [Enterobacteriaceae bacterium ENNIH1]